MSETNNLISPQIFFEGRARNGFYICTICDDTSQYRIFIIIVQRTYTLHIKLFQAMSIQRINLSCKPKEITSKTKLRIENQFLKIQLARVKLVRQRLSEGPAGFLLNVHK
ncbi:Hypothetical_protein [Hexamita inflata]|uniref:Hypothetical_protein n=1 Tax=Hexamita inflata TaxID=28002 RepID=A0AA86PC22_9EUKA|nr:Hypothetical protein HINF_LOCUS23646 [Hexamita inflata]CAI9936011.1 Hypothetical protein HINF_LOCUS23656 [Hexamita inflata]CAI9968420.1 Hypothetical protein HINF_LOCUS56065 [Hexamita inflata]CAI9968422.1 Hypothetical protein HINF_LOCUS56067 [Hexamita inflata]CAI9968425.1 Hypothetical protein HINF_LOCUS56070 [Hexamita inflata]